MAKHTLQFSICCLVYYYLLKVRNDFNLFCILLNIIYGIKYKELSRLYLLSLSHLRNIKL